MNAILISTSVLGTLALIAILTLEVVAFRDRRRRSRQKPQPAGENVVLGSFAARVESAQIDDVGHGEHVVFLKLCVPSETITSLHGGASILIAEEVAVALFVARKDGDE